MMKIQTLLKYSLALLFLFLVIGIGACTSKGDPSISDAPVAEVEQSVSENTEEVSVNEPVEDAEKQVADPEAAWSSSPHADTFVLDAEDNNNTCARCHAPVNWQPSMDELPESCFTCKFELEDPPPYISESDWVDIPCFVCHEKDKKDNIQPEYTWLEIAATEEYAKVDTPTELCQKCHNEAELPGHVVSQLGGAHGEYECTDCHDAHDTVASCGDVDCHGDVVEPAESIAGHDEDHQLVSCEACHDGDALVVGPSEEDGIWRTYVAVPSGDTEKTVSYTSHNIMLDAPCERCHFAENPWGLVETVNVP